MIFEQLIHRDLGCAAYVVGCQASGEAVVVDPALDVAALDEVLARHRARLVAVLETHTHADHVSGHGTLALERGVPVHVHRLAEAEYPHEPLEDGSRIRVGNIELVARHAPGHRPEHTIFLVVDHTRADEPWIALTGDSLFVGDTARPDLAIAGDEGARILYHTLHDGLLQLADGVEVFPGHVAGSLCGRGMSAKASTTIGFERRFNPMLRVEGEAAFATEANRDLVPKPPNLQTVVAINRGPFLPRPPLPERLAAVPADAPLLDVRPSEVYADGHAPGVLHAPASQTGFGNRVGWLLGAQDAPVLVATDEREAQHAAHLLQAAGFLHQARLGDGRAGGDGGGVRGAGGRRARGGCTRRLAAGGRRPGADGDAGPAARRPPGAAAAGGGRRAGRARPRAAHRRGLRCRLASRDGRLAAGAPRLHRPAPRAGRRHEPRAGRRGVGRESGARRAQRPLRLVDVPLGALHGLVRVLAAEQLEGVERVLELQHAHARPPAAVA